MPSLLYERNKETPTIEKRDGCNNLHVIRVVIIPLLSLIIY